MGAAPFSARFFAEDFSWDSWREQSLSSRLQRDVRQECLTS